MTISNFQSVTLPILKFAQDYQEHSVSDTTAHIYTLFNLSLEDINQLTPDGSKREMESRIHWAISFLRKAELIIKTNQNHFRMTELGMRIIKKNPTCLDLEYLGQLPAFVNRDSNN